MTAITNVVPFTLTLIPFLVLATILFLWLGRPKCSQEGERLIGFIERVFWWHIDLQPQLRTKP